MNHRILALALLWLLASTGMRAQGGRGGANEPPQTAKAAAPIDLTGYWVSVITEDWHVRMLTAPKGDFGSGIPGTFPAAPGLGGGVGGRNPATGGNMPYNAEGAR